MIGHCQVEVIPIIVTNIKPIALVVVELPSSEGIIQSAIQSVETSIKYEIFMAT